MCNFNCRLYKNLDEHCEIVRENSNFVEFMNKFIFIYRHMIALFTENRFFPYEIHTTASSMVPGELDLWVHRPDK